MKTKLGLLLLMLLIAVGCDDSTESEQATEQPQPVPLGPSDLPIIELPSITNTIGMTFKEIPAGTFMMGSPEGEPDRGDYEHQHKVTITKPYYMQTTEVTQGQWKAYKPKVANVFRLVLEVEKPLESRKPSNTKKSELP